MRIRSAFALIFASLVASLIAFITPVSAGDYYGGGGYYGPRYAGYNGNGYYGNGNGYYGNGNGYYGNGHYRPRYYIGSYSSSCCYRNISHYQRVGYDGYYGNGYNGSGNGYYGNGNSYYGNGYGNGYYRARY